MSGFVQSVFEILMGFFQSFILLVENQMSNLFQWIGLEIGGFFEFWGSSFSSYGPLVPVLFILSVGLTIAGVMFEFTILDGAEKVVEAA
jgi:hypothetical protein